MPVYIYMMLTWMTYDSRPSDLLTVNPICVSCWFTFMGSGVQIHSKVWRFGPMTFYSTLNGVWLMWDWRCLARGRFCILPSSSILYIPYILAYIWGPCKCTRYDAGTGYSHYYSDVLKLCDVKNAIIIHHNAKIQSFIIAYIVEITCNRNPILGSKEIRTFK